jgi:hypothetical protein
MQMSVAKEGAVPRAFQFGVAAFVLATGALPDLLQALLVGVVGDPLDFALALISELIYNLLWIAPVIVLARHPSGVLHPLILAVLLWPLILALPTILSDFGGYLGLLAQQKLRPPFFEALAWRSAESGWSDLANYNALLILSLLSLYGGYAMRSRWSPRRIVAFSHIDTRRLRSILIGVVLLNLLAVAIFIQLRGGLVEHIAELAFGRFRALAGLGPLLVLFDIGFVALVLWISCRPKDATSPIFVVMLAVVALQQFLVAGSRSATLFVLLLVGLAWALSTQRIPWRLGALFLPVALLSLGALLLVRSAGLTGSTAAEAVQDTSFEAVLAQSQYDLELRQAVSGSIPIVADSMRTTGPMWGYTYSGAVFAMVPRAVWLDKPRGPGSLYAQNFLGAEREGVAVPISATAEAFWNFHLPGVLVMFALYGLLLRWVYEIYWVNRQNGAVIVFFLFFTTQFGASTDSLVAFQQFILTFGLLLLVIFMSYPSAFRDKLARRDPNGADHLQGA